MAIFDAFNISASGLVSERLRLDTISNNIANINTTRTPQGGPYRRQQVIFQEALNNSLWSPGGRATGAGVRSVGIVEDQAPPIMAYDPSHPDANAQGYVAMPNINIVKEMVDLVSASRAYEANVTALNAAKSMAMRALDILT